MVTGTAQESPKRSLSFGKDIVSSSEQLHKPNVCVAVIFMLKITYFIKPR